MRALVTGSAGLVGRHFVSWFDRNGWDVEGCDISYPSDHIWHADCMDVFKEPEPAVDLLVHCAATIPPINERHGCDLAVANDFALDSAMFQWARRAKPGKIVYFSSSAAYPADLQRNPWKLREGDLSLEYIRTPDGMYGLTKLVGELQAHEARKLALDVLVVRPFTGYAWDQAMSYPFPSFIHRAKTRQDPFRVWGSGNQVRDPIHIEDVVACVMALVDAGVPGPVNIGSGQPITMLELARKICEAANYLPDFNTVPGMPEGTFYRCADVTLMNRYYQPKSASRTGIREALDDPSPVH